MITNEISKTINIILIIILNIVDKYIKLLNLFYLIFKSN